MKNQLNLIFFVLLISTGLGAIEQNTYKIRKGDTLSHIVKKLYPGESIYGSDGKLKELLQLNPSIQNPHLIYPNKILVLFPQEFIEQDINLNQKEDKAKEQSENKQTQIPLLDPYQNPVEDAFFQEERELELQSQSIEDPEIEENGDMSFLWNLRGHYGGYFQRISENGIQGEKKESMFFLNFLSGSLDFFHSVVPGTIYFEFYPLLYQKEGEKKSLFFWKFILESSFQSVYGGIEWINLPFYQNRGFGETITSLKLISPYLALKNEWEILLEKPTFLLWKLGLGIPIFSVLESSSFNVKNPRGFFVVGQWELTHRLYKGEFFDLDGVWLARIRYLEVAQDLMHSETRGISHYFSTEISSQLGLGFHF